MNLPTLNMGDTSGLFRCLDQWQQRGGQITCGVEIGTHCGTTSKKLLERYPQLNLYMVDPWATYPPGHPYFITGDSLARRSQEEQDAFAIAAKHITERHALRRTILRLPSVKAAQRLQGRQFSFVFIDGDHSYEAVSQDIDLWWPKVAPPGKTLVWSVGDLQGQEVPVQHRNDFDSEQMREHHWPGGILCGHDIDHPRDKRGAFGVRAAVEEFQEREGLTVNVEGEFWWVEKPAISE